MIRSFTLWLALALAALGLVHASFAGVAEDDDLDGIFNWYDNCRVVSNTPQCDTDLDGYGNACDGDFDNNKSTSAIDFGIFVPDFKKGVDAGKADGTDMECNGVVNALDFGKFVPNFKAGKPGPSGLFCAGTVPCDL
jgi:hypothetical protein